MPYAYMKPYKQSESSALRDECKKRLLNLYSQIFFKILRLYGKQQDILEKSESYVISNYFIFFSITACVY